MRKAKRSRFELGRSGIWSLDLLGSDVILIFNWKFQEGGYLLEGPAGDTEVLCGWKKFKRQRK